MEKTNGLRYGWMEGSLDGRMENKRMDDKWLRGSQDEGMGRYMDEWVGKLWMDK